MSSGRINPSGGNSGLDIAGQVLDVLRSGIASKQTPPVPHTDDEKADAAATLAAYNELGPDYQQAVVESFLDRVDQQLARRNADLVAANRQAGDIAKRNSKSTVGMVAVSLAMAIPLSAIGGGMFGIVGFLTAWFGIVMVALVLGMLGRGRS